MTLRFDANGKPVGLDWSVCTDGEQRPEVWKNWRARKPQEPQESGDEDQENRRPGPQRLEASVERRVIRMYRDEELSALRIAREIGIQSATVFKVLKRNGVPTRTRSEGMKLSRAKRAQQ